MAADNATGLLATAAASGPPLLWTQPDLRLVGPVPGIDSCTALSWLRRLGNRLYHIVALDRQLQLLFVQQH